MNIPGFSFDLRVARRPELPHKRCGPAFDHLDGHVKTLIAEFLDAASLSRFSCTSKAAQLLSMQELWLHHCSSKWGLTPELGQIVRPRALHTVYPYCHFVQNRVHHCSSLRTSLLADGTMRIKYSGAVGVGNRAASSVFPFPEVRDRTAERSMLSTLLNCITFQPKMELNEAVLVSRPFVTATGGVDVTPYPIAYFEVTIHPLAATAREAVGSGYVPECIAVGFSHQHFNLTRMPGWDDLSFGYHSDDGCLFHGKGTQLRAFGPCYGAGDTVGCGIDYRTSEIFYTLNGKLVGVGFSDVAGSLYPTVGIDAHVEVEMNFGSKPYAFSLAHFATIST